MHLAEHFAKCIGCPKYKEFQLRIALELYGCVKELAMKCALYPHLWTDSYHAINRTVSLKLKAVNKVNGCIYSRIHLLLKTTSILFQ